jgi:hypothetical protein
LNLPDAPKGCADEFRRRARTCEPSRTDAADASLDRLILDIAVRHHNANTMQPVSLRP